MRRRPDHARVKHAGQRQVVEILVPPGDLRRHVGPRKRLADEPEPLRVPERRLRVEGDPERLVADQVGIRGGRAAILRTHDAVGGLEVLDAAPEARRAERQQRLPSRGRRLTELRAAAGDTVASGGAALIRRERGVALDHGDALGPDVELLGDDLAHRDAPAGTHVDLAREQGHGPVGVNREECVDAVRFQRLAEKSVRVRNRLGAGERWRQARAHDEDTAGLEEIAAGEGHLNALPRRRGAPRG